MEPWKKMGLITAKWSTNGTKVMIAMIDITTDAFPNERADFGELAERPCATTTHDIQLNISSMCSVTAVTFPPRDSDPKYPLSAPVFTGSTLN